VKVFWSSLRNKKVHFTRVKEVKRKDVERDFGVPARWWRKDDLWYIMQACVLAQNDT
jgi:hypothetical protein